MVRVITTAPTKASQLVYKTVHFSLVVEVNNATTEILFMIDPKKLHTGNCTNTIEILTTSIPEVLENKCYNSKNLPFSEEVLNTPIAHLFEHVLLQSLFNERKSASNMVLIYRGSTKWNWKNELIGTYHIRINANIRDMDIIRSAVENTVNVTHAVIASSEQV